MDEVVVDWRSESIAPGELRQSGFRFPSGSASRPRQSAFSVGLLREHLLHSQPSDDARFANAGV
jgi:hypothetical protein